MALFGLSDLPVDVLASVLFYSRSLIVRFFLNYFSKFAVCVFFLLFSCRLRVFNLCIVQLISRSQFITSISFMSSCLVIGIVNFF